MKKGNKDILTN